MGRLTGRPLGTKNNMKSPEEKERIVLEYINGKMGQHGIAEKHGIVRRLLQKWIHAYQEQGIEGLKSKTGKKTGLGKGRPKKVVTEVEQLKLELLKKEIEIARLKKGYQVKGVGEEKEYVTTFDVNTK